MPPFIYERHGKPIEMSYCQLPEAVFCRLLAYILYLLGDGHSFEYYWTAKLSNGEKQSLNCNAKYGQSFLKTDT